LLKAIPYGVVPLLCVAVFAKVRSRKARQTALLIASYALYLTWGHWFVLVLLASTAMNFLLGQWVRRKHSGLVLWAAILLNLALLGSFKYLPEIAVSSPLSSLQIFSHLALPLGISFWTFQAMSYLFDLYRGEPMDPSLLEFAIYMAFFPVTISGPICRMPEMLPQFRSENALRWDDVGVGLRRIAVGAFMMLLARLLGQGFAGDGINHGFDQATRWSGTDAWCLAFGYGLQLFFDFAGYSHIAIGAGQLLGITAPENFAHPFASTTPSVFWTRWHMSLSFWIRDYVFLRLVVLRRDAWWRNSVLVISMVLFGLWHKASLLFLLWGCYHGVLLVLHRQIQQLEYALDWQPPEPIWTAISRVATITLVSLGWILFRASSLPQARAMFAAVFSPESYTAHYLSGSLYTLVMFLTAGYAAVSLTATTLRRYESEPAEHPFHFVAHLARNRWYWIPPLYILALILLLLVTLTQTGGGAAQLMYRRF
jgi:alginate O-acetyltransferase complex protein AlgI